MTRAADLVLVLHLAVVAFIVCGFVLVPLGARLGWGWVRRRRLRIAHLAAIGYVALTSAVGLACPLTVWEDRLRGVRGAEAGFVERWVGALIYWNLPAWVFTLAYVLLAAYSLWLWKAVPPLR